MQSNGLIGWGRVRAARLLVCCWLLALVLSACDSGTGGSGGGGGSPTPTGQATAAATVGAEIEATPTAAEATATALLAEATATEAQATPGSGTAGEGEFQNPVIRADFADPFVLKDEGTYYAYATNASGRNIQVARSKDLVTWETLTDAMPGLASWAKLGGSFVWAPEVIKIGDKLVLYYTARDKASNKQCVGVGTANSPEGKFADTNSKPLVCQADEGGTIDASPFRDGDKLYLFFKNDGNCCNKPTYLYAQELAPDGMSLVGEPSRLIRNDHAWEGAVVEAPTMWKHEGKYYLFFSGNNYAGFEYAVGYATCDTPTGPCTQAPENPILKSKTTVPLVVGPGHQAIITDGAGNDWMVYHAWEVTSGGTRGSRRFVWIDRLEWQDGKPVVKGPTIDPQPKPQP